MLMKPRRVLVSLIFIPNRSSVTNVPYSRHHFEHMSGVNHGSIASMITIDIAYAPIYLVSSAYRPYFSRPNS